MTANSPLSQSDVQELREWRNQANESLQTIQAMLGREYHVDGVVRFPRGFIRSAEGLRRKFDFVKNDILRTNIAYTVMHSDVHLWLLSRTDLSATAREMIVKGNIGLAGAICEALLRNQYSSEAKKRPSFKRATGRLLAEGCVSSAGKAELDWLWETRCNLHLFEITSREIDRYTDADNSRAVAALALLIAVLKAAK